MLTKKNLGLIVGIISCLAFFNSILASSYPDGLERVAENLEFMKQARDSFSILAGYKLPIGNQLVSSGLAGLLGVLLTYFTLVGIGKLVTNKKGEA
ncbi:hypothetical protein Halha_1755 [Halobacteroides halobius DSM 5150]|uniref:PDGLE domain-containing protein n=1 Tax=Halobacteroides halobius (strain ATCC 35273 / DSM 5150 / MD-1) TaxID=748449 RepID=L0K9K1_HALHC|nr:PDGLE domain-containing protein [Halobacteroides halobius]AGB41691.1 hypothetical protein Halha_1755 [Halobacteroides halobius DSM 5150]